MSKLLRWLRGDLYRAKVGEREIAAKRWHGLSVVGIVIAVILILVLGVFIGYSYPYKTVPSPKLPPHYTVPKTSSPACDGTIDRNGHKVPGHQLGGCLPQPDSAPPAPPPAPSTTTVPGATASTTLFASLERVLSITQTTQGPDLSNNDPVLSRSGQAAIAAHNAFEIDKLNESTGFIDSTAYTMLTLAHAFGIVTGGYDFLHVCISDPPSEARVFVQREQAIGLIQNGTFPGTGDAEYPPSPQCNVRVWIQSWINTVYSLTHRWPMIYTGAWWWNPHVGCWWPAHALAWVSGYTGSVSSVPRPCGQGHIDLWQASDAGYNGAIHGDLSYWLDGTTAFASATHIGPVGPPPALTRSRIAARGRSLHAFYQHGCRSPVLTSGTCGQLAWRVDHYQKLIDTANGYYPRCFGSHRNLGAAECQIVRRAVAVWTSAERSSHHAWNVNLKCIPPAVGGPLPAKCLPPYERDLYFQGRINHTLATSRY